MFTFVGRSGAVSPYLKASSQAIASQVKPLAPPISVAEDLPSVPPAPAKLTKGALVSTVPTQSRISVSSGIGVSQSVRYAHTDIKIPDFSEYRRPSTKDPKKASKDGLSGRQAFTYAIVAGGGVMATYVAKATVNMFVMSMAASADVLALTKITIKLSDIPEGKNVTFKWRGKPLFIKHRTVEDIKREETVDVSSLRDPQQDSDRVQRPEWLVLIGVCTHLGCVPIANAGDYGGYYCPCHGSHYDGSGRIRKGPAPLNLEVPFYEFLDDDTLVVG